MSDPPKHPGIPALSSSSSAKHTRGGSGFDGEGDVRPFSRFLATAPGTSNATRPESEPGARYFPRIAESYIAHLPTPRSQGTANVIPYFPGVTGSPESPLAYSPASSLAFATKRPVSAPLLSSALQEHRSIVKVEPSPLLLASAPVVSSPRNMNSESKFPEVHFPQSKLSSPFAEKARGDENLANYAAFSGTRSVELLIPQPIIHPVNAVELFSPARITENQAVPSRSTETTPPFARTSAESVQGESFRQPGGELDRIRSHLSSLEVAHTAEVENRRPEYFKRLKRNEDVRLLRATMEGDSNEKDGLGITTSPAKGRRLQLFDFQETSAESFEESLMTHGYGTYGEPRTPQRPITAADGRSQEAVNWLAHHTPVGPSPSKPLLHLEPETGPSEKELKKRKRLEAFKGSTERAFTKLYAAEIEGVGRVLLNVPPEEADELLGSPLKKRAMVKKRKGTVIAEKGKTPIRSVQRTGTEPRWVDKELPWCLREKEREDELNARNADRLKWIERYFSHDTDSDDDLEIDKNNGEATSPPLGGQVHENPPIALRRGRGKAVPLQTDPQQVQKNPRDNTELISVMQKSNKLFFPNDPADARLALLSKRSVRVLAQRRLKRNGQRPASLRGLGEGRLACACGRDNDDDGRPAVQCDECFNWHHLECIGVRDESELGDEDDPWFCHNCTSHMRASTPDWVSQRQPTFAPTEDRPVHTDARNDVAFYSSSPLRDWSSPATLQTPIHGQGRIHDEEFFRRSIWDDTSGPGPLTPVNTSRSVRIFTPGGRSDDNNHEQTGIFDNTTSPSRTGFQSNLKPSAFTTPKNTNASVASGGTILGMPWSGHAGGLYTTPTPRTRHANPNSAGYSFVYGPEDSAGASFTTAFGQFSRANAMYAMDDTPISRVHPTREARASLSSLHTSFPTGHADSPLAGRGDWAYVAGQMESPVARLVGIQGKEGEGGNEGKKPSI
ncbi:hypothetical protein DFH11DRAFT_87371 [Phellopilus nigrolimitatus]|nr:hypothetical protein DFH11DRAFT_87371 [Phellopilus nigrolimitatus]